MDWGGPTAPSGLLVYKTNYWIFGFSKAFLTWRDEGRSQIIWTLLSCYFMRAFLQQSAQSGHFSPKPDQLFKKNSLFSPKISPLFIPHSFTFLFRLSEFYIVEILSSSQPSEPAWNTFLGSEYFLWLFRFRLRSNPTQNKCEAPIFNVWVKKRKNLDFQNPDHLQFCPLPLPLAN